MPGPIVQGICLFLVLAGAGRSAGEEPVRQPAEEEDHTAQQVPAEVYDRLLVTGGAGQVEEIAGSGHYLGRATLERQAHSDIHRVLRRIEGVTVQEEDGFGLRPNIGMRGTGVNRSEKITLLEDGVLIAPAPYAAPAAYYFPTSERMEAIEVRKGSSAVAQGPYTTGGVINLVSTSIPGRRDAAIRVAAGSHETVRAHGRVGDSRERFGWLLEGYRLDSGGFKDLDGGGSTGVELDDLLGKVRWNSPRDATAHQSIELKLGRTVQDGRETYLGLTSEDFSLTPNRRYAASSQDFLDADHEQVQIRYVGSPGTKTFVTASLYRNTFFRNWHKLQSVDDVGLNRVLTSPELFPEQLMLLAGEADAVGGRLAVRNNRRQYLSEGIEARGSLALGEGRVSHELEMGVRLHRDEEDRFQEEDLWDIADGRMRLWRLGAPGSQSNRITGADAAALYVSDTVRWQNWTISPGVRFEWIDFEVLDYGRRDPSRQGEGLVRKANAAEVVLPGIGISYRQAPGWSLFGGVHRGFAAPGPGQDPDTEAEESLNYELGFQLRPVDSRTPGGLRFVGFYNDYDNLIGRDSLATGGDGTDRTFNGGRVSVVGIEAALDLDIGGHVAAAESMPVRVGYTWTEAEFASSFRTSFADWAPEVTKGDRLPYVPGHQLSLSWGWVAPGWDCFLDIGYRSKTRTKPGTGPVPREEEIAAHTVVDLASHLELGRGVRLSLLIRNLLDETYVAARRPAGLRPGLPRAVMIGLEWTL